MRLSQLRKLVEQLSAGGGEGPWRDIAAFSLSLTQLRAAGSSIIQGGGNSIGSSTNPGASSGILIDDTATEARFVAVALGDEASAGIAVSLRLHEAGPVPAANPTLEMYSDVIAELDIPTLTTNGQEFLAGEASPVIDPLNLHLVEIEVAAPGAWPVGSTVQLLARLQVR